MLNSVINNELEVINKCKFIEFIEIDGIILPVFLNQNNEKLIVTPKEYWSICDNFCSSNEYLYFIKHWE